MNTRKTVFIALILLVICILIHVYCSNQLRVEIGYSRHLYPLFSRGLRYCFGWIPFSIGDILYLFLLCWLFWKLCRFFVRMFGKGRVPSRKIYLKNFLLKALAFLSITYIIFNICWGINYDRKGIAWQLGLKIEKYSKEDLQEINCLLIDRINQSKRILLLDAKKYPSNGQLYTMVSDAYNHASVKYPFLNYKPASIKTSVWGWLGNYAGFTGYYNPFTGEAQLNTTVPPFLHAFIACPEAAHQLGYAKEMEANFVGYLAAAASMDTLFHYSVYLDLFTYANRNLFIVDSADAKLYRHELDTSVIADYRQWFEFNRQHQNPAEPVIRWIYGKYLEGNSQPQGLFSYDEVTAFIISYYKKFGKL